MSYRKVEEVEVVCSLYRSSDPYTDYFDSKLFATFCLGYLVDF